MTGGTLTRVDPMTALHTPFKVVKHSQTLDVQRRYLTDSPTPDTFAALLKDVDQGDIAAMVEMNEEMEAKDAHLQGVAYRRRESVTALEWDIDPDPNAEDTARAEQAADFVRATLDGIREWPETLEHLATAIGPGIAVVELVWDSGRLIKTVDVPCHRLMGDWIVATNEVFIETDEHSVQGVLAVLPKFVVHKPNTRAGFPLRVTITRAQAWLFVIKHYGMADWASFSETYGQPMRVAIIEDSPNATDRDKIEQMLKNMGADMWAVFDKGTDIKFIEAARSNQPFEGLIDWCERKQSVLYLGQTLTTEQGAVGSLALGRVHDNVRASITLSDIQQERRSIGGQIIRPIVAMRWPQGAPLPVFKRRVVEDKNLDAERLAIDKFRFAAERGIDVDEDHVRDVLDLPRPKDLATPPR